MSDLPIRVIASPVFLNNIKSLAEKYRNIAKNIQPIVAQLGAGEFLGDQIPNVGYAVFKLRIRNNDAQKGKSGGYRLIYYLKTNDSIILLTLYSKSEKSDIDTDILKDIIFAYDLQNTENSDLLKTDLDPEESSTE